MILTEHSVTTSIMLLDYIYSICRLIKILLKITYSVLLFICHLLVYIPQLLHEVVAISIPILALVTTALIYFFRGLLVLEDSSINAFSWSVLITGVVMYIYIRFFTPDAEVIRVESSTETIGFHDSAHCICSDIHCTCVGKVERSIQTYADGSSQDNAENNSPAINENSFPVNAESSSVNSKSGSPAVGKSRSPDSVKSSSPTSTKSSSPVSAKSSSPTSTKSTSPIGAKSSAQVSAKSSSKVNTKGKSKDRNQSSFLKTSLRNLSNAVNNETVDILTVDNIWNIYREIIPDDQDATPKAVPAIDNKTDQWLASDITRDVITHEVQLVVQDVLWDIALELEDTENEEQD